LVPTLLASGLFADSWRNSPDKTFDNGMWGYAAPIALGAMALFASLIPLVWMPDVYRPAPAKSVRASGLWMALADSRFQRLLLFGCWFSFFNGLPQSAQNIFPFEVLALGVLQMAALRVVMQFGQVGLAPVVGSFSDRFGNRPVLIVCQLIVAAAPLFYLAATPEQPWWIVGAWIVFSFYIGLNVCLPNLMLKLAPGHDKSAYVASYFGITGLAYAVGTITGGWLLDFLETMMMFERFEVGAFSLSRFGYLFYVAWVTRTLGVILLLAVIEPGAWSWREILAGRRAIAASPAEAAEFA